MNQRLEAVDYFLDSRFQYDFTIVPGQEPDDRMNCLTLVHAACKRMLGYELPKELLCTELYEDRAHTQHVSSDDLKAGDLVWFGQADQRAQRLFVPQYDENGRIKNWANSPLQHVGVYIGRDDFDNPQILHASQQAGTNVVQSLDKIRQEPKHAHVLDISRLKAA